MRFVLHPVSLIHAAANLPARPQILARKVPAVESDLSDVLLSCVVHDPEEGPAPNSNIKPTKRFTNKPPKYS